MLKWNVMLSSPGSQPTEDGTVSVCRVRMQGTMGWRAVFLQRGSSARIYGCMRIALGDTVKLLLDKIAAMLARGERERVLGLALRHGSQPGSQPTMIPSSSSVQPIRRPASASDHLSKIAMP